MRIKERQGLASMFVDGTGKTANYDDSVETNDDYQYPSSIHERRDYEDGRYKVTSVWGQNERHPANRSAAVEKVLFDGGNRHRWTLVTSFITTDGQVFFIWDTRGPA
jgi:hypothetical protein